MYPQGGLVLGLLRRNRGDTHLDLSILGGGTLAGLGEGRGGEGRGGEGRGGEGREGEER